MEAAKAMIVKCKQLYNANTKEYHAGPSYLGLTIGNFYSVLEVYYEDNEVFYRIFDDATYEFQVTILKRADDFEIISGKIPPNWELIRREYSSKLSPKMWNIFEPWEESFWQDYDNNLPKAKQCFDDELRIIFDTDADYIKQIDQKLGRTPYFPS